MHAWAAPPLSTSTPLPLPRYPPLRSTRPLARPDCRGSPHSAAAPALARMRRQLQRRLAACAGVRRLESMEPGADRRAGAI